MTKRNQELLLPTDPARIRDLLERAGIGRWEWEIATGNIRWDTVLTGIAGWPEEEAPDIDVLKSMIDPIDRRRLAAVVNDMLNNGHGKIQLRFQRQDGDLRYVSIDGIVEFDPDKSPKRAFGYVQDLTALHMAEIEIEKKNDDLIIINYINEKLNSGAELKSIYQDILDWFSFQFHSSGLAIGYRNETDAIIRIVFQSFKDLGPYKTKMINGFPSEIRIDNSPVHQDIMKTRRMKGIPFSVLWHDISPGQIPLQVSLLEDDNPSPDSGESLDQVWLVPLFIEENIIGIIYVFGLRALTVKDQLRIEAISNQISGIVVRKRTEDRIRFQRKELSRLSQRLFQVQEEERRNLSLELHDELGQSLTAMRINLSAVQQAVEQVADERTLARIRDTIRMIDEKEEQIRDISLLLRPSMLDDLGLEPTLEWYINYYKKRNKESVRFHYNLQNTVLPPDVDVVLYRVIQEALTNISRHARATRITIQLMEREKEILVEIRDNGIGFDSREILTHHGKRKTAGLVGMHERVKMVTGSLDILSIPNKGTTIRILIPKEKTHDENFRPDRR
ncbi:MAG: ATP-binding protein [Fidelibacterota bacterium]